MKGNLKKRDLRLRNYERAPNNSSYNQWYGVCLYETGDKKSAEKYLKVAAKRNVQEAYRYLGNFAMKHTVSKNL